MFTENDALKINLSMAQKEELLEVIVNSSGGSVSYDPKGVVTTFNPSGKPSFLFKGNEDVMAFASSCSFDIFSADPVHTRLDGIADIRLSKVIFDSINSALMSAPRTSMGYDKFGHHLTQVLEGAGISCSGDIAMKDAVKVVLNRQDIEDLARKTLEFQYDKTVKLTLVQEIMEAFESKGISFYSQALHKRVSSPMPANMIDKNSPTHKVSSPEKVQLIILKIAEHARSNHLVYREFVKMTHKKLYSRNIAIEHVLDQESEAPYPASSMSPDVVKTLMKSYSKILNGDKQGAQAEISQLNFHDDDYVKMYGAKDASPEVKSAQYHDILAKKMFKAKVANSTVMEMDEKSYISSLVEDMFEKGRGAGGITQEITRNLIISVLKSTLFSVNPKDRESALNNLERNISLIPEKSQLEEYSKAERARVANLVTVATNTIVSAFSAVQDLVPELVKSEIDAWNRIFPQGEIPYGQDLGKSIVKINLMTSDMPKRLFDEGANRIRNIYPRIKGDLRDYSSKENEWLGIYNSGENIPKYDADSTNIQKWDSAQQTVLLASLMQHFETEIKPGIAVEIPSAETIGSDVSYGGRRRF
jgi:hypothetical protein